MTQQLWWKSGIIIEDKSGNQFVWIPAKTETAGGANIKLLSGKTVNIVYIRKNYEKFWNGIYENYTENLSDIEENSINKNGGYYIGRYETGDEDAQTYREGTTDIRNIAIKEGQVPYNWISYNDAENIANSMWQNQNYTTSTTELLSGYAWDTAIEFIQSVNSDNYLKDYGVSSPDGNYGDTQFYYANIGENDKNSLKPLNEAIIVPTGQTNSVCNIYDMGGNLLEWVTEKYSNNSDYVDRGGGCIYSYVVQPAGFRGNWPTANVDIGFRIGLYLN